MKYAQPYGITDPEAPYINGNPSTGTMGSIPPAASIEHPQREIVNLIKDAALVPDDLDLHQLSKGVQGLHLSFSEDIGTINAVLLALAPVPDTYTDGMQIRFRAKFGPTGPTTLDAGRGAKPLQKSGGGALTGAEWQIGDIVECTYDAPNNRWQLPVSPYASLYAPRTYYVNAATGNDANDGRTLQTPFKTLQHAQDTTTLYNLNGFNITIQIADGVYGSVACGAINGAGSIFYQGNNANPAAVLLTNNAGSAFGASGRGYIISGFKVTSSGRGPYVGTTGNGVWAVGGGTIGINQIDFGNCVDFQCVADGSANIGYWGPITISGGGACHIMAANGSYVRQGGPPTAAICIAPVNIGAFIAATGNGVTYVMYSPFQNPNNVTGAKYNVSSNGVVGGGGGANYYPGNSPGVAANGGQYV